MSTVITAIIGCSLVALLVLLALSARNTDNWRRLVVEVIGLLLFVATLYVLFGFPLPKTNLATKGPTEDFIFAAALYICMLLGMGAQFLYRHFEQPRHQRQIFDWGVFLAPVFASPVIFLPLLASFQNAEIDLRLLTVPRLMIFLVAFQNGFFWKEHFDRRQMEAKGDGL
jgi:hypothetical protein